MSYEKLPSYSLRAQIEMVLFVSVLAHDLKVIGSGRNPAGGGVAAPPALTTTRPSFSEGFSYPGNRYPQGFGQEETLFLFLAGAVNRSS